MAFQPLDLDSIFSYHPATDKTGPVHDAVRQSCKGLAEHLTVLTPSCPEQTLAIRSIQEAMMWANSAIAQNGAPATPSPALGHHGADG